MLEVNCKSSIAEAYLISVGSDQAVFMRARPNGRPPLRELMPAGIVRTGYPFMKRGFWLVHRIFR